MTLRTLATGLLVALTLSLSQSTAPAATFAGQQPAALAAMQPAKADPIVESLLKGKMFIQNADYYDLESKEFTRLTFQTIIVYHKTFLDLATAYGDPDEVGKVMAFTIINKLPGVCEIHIMDPKIIWYPQYVGHELMHCIHGNFHPSR